MHGKVYMLPGVKIQNVVLPSGLRFNQIEQPLLYIPREVERPERSDPGLWYIWGRYIGL